MDQLITIERVPIKIEYVEKETASSSAASQSARLNISRSDNKMVIQSDPISISLTDSFELQSANWNNLTYTATAQYSTSGNLSMNVKMQSSGDYTYQYQQFGRGIDHLVDSVTSTANSTSAQSGSTDNAQWNALRIDFDMSGFMNNINTTNNSSTADNSVDASFYPPDLELKVVERAKVIIKYVGGPIYFPKSADPEYVTGESAVLYFPESADPNYDEKMMQLENSKGKLDLKA